MTIVGKHIVLTGGASGLGLELLKQLHNENEISVIARASTGLDNLRRSFDGVHVYEADLADLQSVETAADLLVRSGKKIDVLINNAAVQYTPHFLAEDFRYETIKREIDINFTSVCSLIYLLLPNLLQPNPSMIVNINSGLGLVPKTSSAVYCATKGALNLLSKSLAYQLESTNIEVKQVFLPLLDTAMTKGRGAAKISAGQASAEIIGGMQEPGDTIDVGKVKLLRLILRIAPRLAQTIMKAG
ncbi:SDR family NAD(P)-dependent oxidoreductase [Hoeflea sp. YIM 152468]|uniref:SDR family NAD(P)-dependent oxidoreductase n=1 Tax=Hoeflea sp. YIM 152468 TaxID=3031759 RepID=UPI0023DBCE2A|nr:SDR family NAD(P)-dependent oxidoreductase [Hoeflea sp. YIM 152468]MDF1607831.1 SDR family NAD(P)-dependent oxidoreductase [Hoeflea sp. YIM 152468]